MNLKNKIIASGIVFVFSLAGLAVKWHHEDNGDVGGPMGMGRMGRMRGALGVAIGSLFPEWLWLILSALSGLAFIFYHLKYFKIL